ncbi:MAG: transcriptional regulator [Thermoprotei archaeon]|nr:MAG: transcriptional regulator [Thermoprotei archaeon]RLF20290.1 MAG: transcriptional regulator [Thermoprotei archaeon]
MPEDLIKEIDYLIKTGRFTSRSEVIRAAVRELLKSELDNLSYGKRWASRGLESL